MIQHEGQTSLNREDWYRLPTAGTSPFLLSLPALIRMGGGNEQPGSPNKREKVNTWVSWNLRSGKGFVWVTIAIGSGAGIVIDWDN